MMLPKFIYRSDWNLAELVLLKSYSKNIVCQLGLLANLNCLKWLNKTNIMRISFKLRSKYLYFFFFYCSAKIIGTP